MSVEKLPIVVKKSGLSVFIAFLFQGGEKTTTTKSNSGGRKSIRSGAFLCALAVFWCEVPRAPYMVKAERECEAEGSVICYHSARVK